MDDHHAGTTYGLKPADALKHLFVVGPTGVGKSTFLFWFALSAIRQGHGILLLDPKGDLARALLGAIPAAREPDVVALDFSDTDWPVGLNPLDVRDADEGDRVAMAVYSMLRELVRGEDFLWGTSMSQAFAYGFRTLAANPQIKPTMLDLERLFMDRDWREGLVANVTDPFLRSYWRNQVDRISVRQFEMTFGGALRRMAMLVQDPRVRNILVQPRSAVRWDGVLRRGEIVLVNLDQADTALGAAGSRLLGSILVTQFWQAVLRRPTSDRAPYFAIIDEFQEFLDTGTRHGRLLRALPQLRRGTGGGHPEPRPSPALGHHQQRPAQHPHARGVRRPAGTDAALRHGDGAGLHAGGAGRPAGLSHGGEDAGRQPAGPPVRGHRAADAARRRGTGGAYPRAGPIGLRATAGDAGRARGRALRRADQDRRDA